MRYSRASAGVIARNHCAMRMPTSLGNHYITIRHNTQGDNNTRVPADVPNVEELLKGIGLPRAARERRVSVRTSKLKALKLNGTWSKAREGR